MDWSYSNHDHLRLLIKDFLFYCFTFKVLPHHRQKSSLAQLFLLNPQLHCLVSCIRLLICLRYLNKLCCLEKHWTDLDLIDLDFYFATYWLVVISFIMAFYHQFASYLQYYQKLRIFFHCSSLQQIGKTDQKCFY